METSVDTIIGINVTLKGNLYNKGAIEVNGNVEGEIKSDENIIIGETAMIKGPVVAKKIEISGEVRGLVEASEKLELNATSKVIGDINTKSLIIKEGATFVGKSLMNGTASPAAETKEEKAEEPKEAEKQSSREAEDVDKPAEEKTDKMGFFSKK